MSGGMSYKASTIAAPENQSKFIVPPQKYHLPARVSNDVTLRVSSAAITIRFRLFIMARPAGIRLATELMYSYVSHVWTVSISFARRFSEESGL